MMRDRGPVLVDTRICPQLQCGSDVPGCENEDEERLDPALVADCWVAGVEGPAILDGDCLVVEGAGEVVWRWNVQECAANDLGYAPESDLLTLPAVAVDGVTARLESPGDAFALRALEPGPEPAFPDDARVVPGGTVQVLADHEVPFAIVLDHPDHDKPVAWNPGAWTAEVVTDAGDPIAARFDATGVLVVSVPAGVEADVAIVLEQARLPAGRVRGVAEAELASLEVVAGYAPGGDEENDHGPPIGARAIFRAADGTPVFGVPVQWEVQDGAFPVWRGTERAWGPDYVALMDEEGRACHRPPEREARTFRGLLVASRGDFEAEVELRWTEDPEHSNLLGEIGDALTQSGHRDSELCQGPGFPPEGCGCRTTTSPGWAMLAPLLLLLRLRRRRRTG
jgi:MYXO-CTERM domain-containing protein